MTTNQGVIPSLMDVLSAARSDAGKELRHLRALTETTERQLRRYEKKESFPPGAEIDDLVVIYAEAVGCSVFDLWDEAITGARVAATTSGDDAEGAARRGLPPSRARPKRRRRTGS